MIEFTHRLRVLYGHTDQMGIVYYGRYYEFFEAGRNELLRNLDLPYYRMEEQGLFLPVVESHASYKGSFTYDDWVTIRTMVKELPSVKIRIDYELTTDAGELMVTGHTVHAFVDKQTRRPKRVPDSLLQVFRPYFKE